MKIVLDNNIFFSLFNTNSVNSYLFYILNAEFFAPEYIKSELDKYKSECLAKSRLSEHEFEMRKQEVEESIKFFNLVEYEKLLDKAIAFLPDPKDAPYLALALSTNSSIWSNDPHLKKQNLIKVYTTKELLDKILNK